MAMLMLMVIFNCIPESGDPSSQHETDCDLIPEGLTYTHVEFLDEAFLHPEGLGGMKLDRLQVEAASCENCSGNLRYFCLKCFQM